MSLDLENNLSQKHARNPLSLQNMAKNCSPKTEDRYRSAIFCSFFDPEALQSGFGVNFFFGLANFRKITGEFLSEFCQRIFPANF